MDQAKGRIVILVALNFLTPLSIIIIIIIIIISFMQGIYTHIPETNYVPREHGVAAILLFLFMVLISLLLISLYHLLYAGHLHSYSWDKLCP